MITKKKSICLPPVLRSIAWQRDTCCLSKIFRPRRQFVGCSFIISGRAFTKNVIVYIIILMASSLLVSCGKGQDDLSRYIQKTKQRKGRPVEPIPELADTEKFEYPEDVKRRSPFVPVVRQKARDRDELAPDQNRPKMPLEEFPLDSLKFVGTLEDGATKWGLVTDPNRRIVRVKPGDYMGQNYGKIIRVTENSLVLQETIQVGGKWEKRTTTLQLKSSD